MSQPPRRGTSYHTGETIKFAVNFNEAVEIDTTGDAPRLALKIGTTTRYATYLASESTSTKLVFSYTVVTEDYDGTGISIPRNALQLNGNDIENASGNSDANHSLAGLPDQWRHRVNYTEPPGLVFSASSLEVPEGDKKAYTVKLATRPLLQVTVTLGGITGTDLTLDKTSLTFTATNWNTAQTVTVSAADDNDGTNDR